MAAVAGSKGRIAFPSSPSASFQASVARSVLDQDTPPAKAAVMILDRAMLREVGIDTNMICNLACKYCYLNDRPEGKGKVHPTQWIEYLEPTLDAGCKLIAFIGKEPLADTIALETVHLLKKQRRDRKSFRIGMVTNGTFIDRRLDSLHRADLDYLDVSLDSLGSINDRMRGEGVFDRVVANLKLYLSTKPKHDFSITSVLHSNSLQHYPDFIDFLFGLGIKTAFGSPVLRFTDADTAAPIATSVKSIVLLIEKLQSYLSKNSSVGLMGRQVIIDLPYKYSWLFIQQDLVDCNQIFEDKYEAHVWQPDSSIPLFVKFNFLPMSYWRAIRVTHDAQVIENMDLAAHRLYKQNTRPCDDSTNRWYFGNRQPYHSKFFADFLTQHASLSEKAGRVHDRDVNHQFQHLDGSQTSQSRELIPV